MSQDIATKNNEKEERIKELYEKYYQQFVDNFGAEKFKNLPLKAIQSLKDDALEYAKNQAEYEIETTIDNFYYDEPDQYDNEQEPYYDDFPEETKVVSLHEKFSVLFNSISYYNQIPGQMFFYSLMSIILKHKVFYNPAGKLQTIHVHSFFIQDTGSGKDMALDFLIDIIKAYNLKIAAYNMNNSTDYNIIKYHRLTGTDSVESFFTRPQFRKGKIQLELEHTKGLLEDNDLIFSNECSFLFTEKQGEKQVKREYLLTALEGKEIPKSLVSWEGTTIVTKPDFVFIGTSRPFGNMKQHIANSGFQQRGLNYFRELDYEMREKMFSKTADGFSATSPEFKNMFEDFVNELVKIRIASDVLDIDWNLQPHHSNIVKEEILKLLKEVDNELTDFEQKQILNGFISRYHDLIMKMSMINAIIESATKIRLCNIYLALDMIKECNKSLFTWAEDNIKKDFSEVKEENNYLMTLKKIFYESKEEELLLKYVAEEFSARHNKSEPSAYRILKKFYSGKNSILEITEVLESNAKKLKFRRAKK